MSHGWLTTLISSLASCAVIATAAAVSGCSGTSTGNPLTGTDGNPPPTATLRFARDNQQNSPSAPPSATPSGTPIAVSNVLFCYGHVAFTSSNGQITTLPFAVGDLGFGATLGTVPLSPGTYTKIRLFLSPQCPSGNSVQFTGPLGPLATADNVTLTFQTMFTQTDASSVITLKSQEFADALAAVTLPSQIQPALQAVVGLTESVMLADRRSLIRKAVDFGKSLFARKPQALEHGADRSPASNGK